MVRATIASSPPEEFIQSSCSAIRKSVATEGVLTVWALRDCLIASVSEKNDGMCRPLAAISSARAIAVGESSASQRPPSEANDFCGAK